MAILLERLADTRNFTLALTTTIVSLKKLNFGEFSELQGKRN